MKVEMSETAEIAIRTLSANDRRPVLALIQSLENWDADPSLRELCQQISTGDYVLKSTINYNLVFRLHDDGITVIDILRRHAGVSTA